MINEVAVCQYAGETSIYFENTFYLVSHRIAQQTQVEQVQYTGATKSICLNILAPSHVYVSTTWC